MRRRPDHALLDRINETSQSLKRVAAHLERQFHGFSPGMD